MFVLLFAMICVEKNKKNFEIFVDLFFCSFSTLQYFDFVLKRLKTFILYFYLFCQSIYVVFTDVLRCFA